MFFSYITIQFYVYATIIENIARNFNIFSANKRVKHVLFLQFLEYYNIFLISNIR